MPASESSYLSPRSVWSFAVWFFAGQFVTEPKQTESDCSTEVQALVTLVYCSASFPTSKNRLSLATATKQNYFDRLKHDDGIQNQTLILDVEQIVLKFLTRIFN